jgi:tetratricopeptide (TPR) repeat protein
MKAYTRPDPARVLDAFAKAVAANERPDPQAKANALAILAEAKKDPSLAQGALVRAVAALHPAFREALAAFQEEEPGAAAALARLHGSEDLYLAAHAAYFEGRAHMMAERYEEALPLLAEVAGAWIDKTLFAGESLFLVGICQGELLRRDAAARVLRDFIQHYPDAPERMRVGADHVVRVIQWTDEGSLVDVQDRMDDSRRRLTLERSGSPTQEKQERIIAMLDRLIEEAEEQEQGGGSGGGGAGQGGRGGPPSGNQIPGSPANDSSLPGGQARIGALDRATRGRADEVWGNVRQREREKVLNVLKAKFPDRYRELLEQYYKSLQKTDR